MGMTLAELTQAIQQHIDLEMDEEVARGMAEHTLWDSLDFTTELLTMRLNLQIGTYSTCFKIMIY